MDQHLIPQILPRKKNVSRYNTNQTEQIVNNHDSGEGVGPQSSLCYASQHFCMLEITKKKLKKNIHHHLHTHTTKRANPKERMDFLNFLFANGNKNIALQLGLQSLYFPGMGWTQALISPGGYREGRGCKPQVSLCPLLLLTWQLQPEVGPSPFQFPSGIT